MNTMVSRLFVFGSAIVSLWGSTASRLHAAASISSDYPIEYQNPNYKTSEQSTGSGVTWWPAQSTYLLLDNTIGSYAGGTGPRLLEFNTSHSQVREIVLRGFKDPEDIHWISGNTFVISQEFNNNGSVNELVILTIPTTGNFVDIATAGTRRLTFPTSSFGNNHNLGIEACAIVGNNFYFTTEKAPLTPANAWKVWTVPNTGSGLVTPTVAFDVPTALLGHANDVSGMATDGTHLWILSHEGTGTASSPVASVFRVTTAGAFVAEYLLPTFSTGAGWSQAEGIELYVSPTDNVLKILLTGEDPSTSGSNPGTDFMKLTQQTVSITANDPDAAEPEGGNTFPGQFTVTRNVNPSVSLVVNISTAGSTATSGSDYTPIGTTVTIAASAYSATINVNPMDDAAYERDETVQVTISPNGVYAPVTPSSATVTIQSVFELAGASYVYDVNDSGQAVTDAGKHNSDGTLAATYAFGVNAINNAGDVAGGGYAKIGGVTYALGQLNGYDTIATAINSSGWMAGYNGYGDGCFWTFSGGTLSGPYYLCNGASAAYGAINDAGMVVGGGYPGQVADVNYCSSTFDLAQPLSTGQYVKRMSGGTVVGAEVDWYTLRYVPVLWYPGSCSSGSATTLDYPPNGASGMDAGIFINGIDANGPLAGTILEPAGNRACVYGVTSSGTWDFLDDVMGDANWVFGDAIDISNNGHIIGFGAHNGQGRCFLIRK